MSSPVLQRLGRMLEEHRALLQALDPAQADALVEAILAARHVFFTGQGRSGNMNRALAIRLMHAGIAVHVAGEPSTPAIGAGDLLIAVSASARTQATLEHMQVAKKAGAAVALVSSAMPATPLAPLVVVIPARSQVASDQHAGSLFEQGLLLLGDAVAWQVQQRRGASEADLDARHANLQ